MHETKIHHRSIMKIFLSRKVSLMLFCKIAAKPKRRMKGVTSTTPEGGGGGAEWERSLCAILQDPQM